MQQIGRRQVLAAGIGALGLLAVGGVVGAADAATEQLVVADVGRLSLDEQLLFACLQGLVNRGRPRLYLEGLRSAQDFAVDTMAAYWLAHVVDGPVTRLAPDEVLAQFGRRAGGLVVWDPALPYDTQNVATTMCGQLDLLPASPARAAALSGPPHRLAVRYDLRRHHFASGSDAYRWALLAFAPPSRFGALAWTGWPRNGNPVQPGLRDWIVAARGFAFDGSPTVNGGPFAAGDPSDNATFVSDLLSSFPPGTAVLGYPFFDDSVYRASGEASGEPFGVGEISRSGHYLIPSLDCTNMTVHQASAPVAQRPRWDDRPERPDPAKTYVAFLISDGDNLGYNEQGLWTRHWSDPARGAVPIGISISPWLAVYAPHIYRYYVEGLRDSEVLVAGPSGAGYVYPSFVPDLPGYLQRTKALMELAGLRAIWLLDLGYAASPPPTVTAAYASALRPSVIFADYGGWVVPNPPAVSSSGGVPVVHVAWGPDVSSTVARVRAGGATSGTVPGFVAVGLTTWTMGCSQARAVMSQLGSGYEAVRPDRFVGLIRGSRSA